MGPRIIYWTGGKVAGREAIEEIKDETVGLGWGATVYYFLEVLDEKIVDIYRLSIKILGLVSKKRSFSTQ